MVAAKSTANPRLAVAIGMVNAAFRWPLSMVEGKHPQQFHGDDWMGGCSTWQQQASSAASKQICIGHRWRSCGIIDPSTTMATDCSEHNVMA